MRVFSPTLKGARAGLLPVIEVSRTKQTVRHLCEISSSVDPYPILVAEMSTIEFDQWYVPDTKTPAEKVAGIYKERALRLGASPEALSVIGKLTPLSAGDHDMATTKAAPAEKPKRHVRDPKGTAALKAHAEQKAEKPAKAPKEEKEPRRSASSVFKELIMQADGRTGQCKHTDDEIFAMVQEEFGLDDNKRSYVAWYRNDLRKKGENPPEPKGGAKPAEKPAKGSDEAKAKMAAIRGKRQAAAG